MVTAHFFKNTAVVFVATLTLAVFFAVILLNMSRKSKLKWLKYFY